MLSPHDVVSMVNRQLRARGITDERVLAAMETVPRADFVPSGARRHAFEDRPLSIGSGQTISQPYVVALMLEALELTRTDRLLEVGVGSGYVAAVAAEIAAEVHGVERVVELAERARDVQTATNVHIHHGDGTLGWADAEPFDAIIVSAAGPAVPEPLIDQLADGGRLVMPVGDRGLSQWLVRVRRDGDSTSTEQLVPVAFVPLVGAHGWDG